MVKHLNNYDGFTKVLQSGFEFHLVQIGLITKTIPIA